MLRAIKKAVDLIFHSLSSSVKPSPLCFLIAKDSVVVKTAKIGPNKTPIATEIRVKITYGLNEEKYFYLTEGSPNKKWFPNVGKIESWIRVKNLSSLVGNILAVACGLESSPVATRP